MLCQLSNCLPEESQKKAIGKGQNTSTFQFTPKQAKGTLSFSCLCGNNATVTGRPISPIVHL
jgi:hypothetical protein